MQKFVFLLLLLFSGTKSFSQQEFFVYVQADDHQPFYARINTKIYSSSETGQMIIPKLSDSTYEVVIGFAKNAFPEQIFSIPINKRDKGFQLKNLGEKGWAMVNLQNMSVIINAGIFQKQALEMSGVRKTDAFSELLANVVNDTSVLYTIVKTKSPEPVPEKTASVTSKEADKNQTKKEALTFTDTVAQLSHKELIKQEDSVWKPNKAIAKTKLKDTLAKTKSDVISPPAKKEEIITAKDSISNEITVVEKPFITKINEQKTGDAYQATYLEQYILTTDTIKITILLSEVPVVKTQAPPTVIEKKNDSMPVQKNAVENKTPLPKPVVVDTTSRTRAILITNSDCKNFASDYDVDKIRVKLISDKTIDDKLTTAKKYFKTKCMSVKQIRALTELFPSDETKYRFFDVAYPFVSDTSNFYQLEELIENNYFKNRFKAMILK
ncbi:MAG: DUF4476 domain-containing protein [Chitinophagaceae bacterium]